MNDLPSCFVADKGVGFCVLSKRCIDRAKSYADELLAPGEIGIERRATVGAKRAKLARRRLELPQHSRRIRKRKILPLYPGVCAMGGAARFSATCAVAVAEVAEFSFNSIVYASAKAASFVHG